jgi:hypothetical protein
VEPAADAIASTDVVFADENMFPEVDEGETVELKLLSLIIYHITHKILISFELNHIKLCNILKYLFKTNCI